jgi:hypothetical protein
MTDIQIESGLPKTPTRKRAQKPDAINYDAAVVEGRQIVQSIETAESARMRLGELADQVETQYGKKTLKNFAKDIGMALCTLERSRSTYRAWVPIPAVPPNFSVAQELQALPDKDKVRIIKDTPNITASQARKKRIEYKEAKQKADPNFPFEQQKKWLDALLQRASKVVAEVDKINAHTPQERRLLKKAIKMPSVLDELLEGERAFKTIHEALQQLVNEPA